MNVILTKQFPVGIIERSLGEAIKKLGKESLEANLWDISGGNHGRTL